MRVFQPRSVATFCRQTGFTEATILKYAKAGRLLGARKHPLTKKWWIYPPAILITQDGDPVRFPPGRSQTSAASAD